MPDGAKWQIVFYSKKTGAISRKHGYKRRQEAVCDLRKNGFAEDASGVWMAENWLAKIREDNENENVQRV